MVIRVIKTLETIASIASRQVFSAVQQQMHVDYVKLHHMGSLTNKLCTTFQ